MRNPDGGGTVVLIVVTGKTMVPIFHCEIHTITDAAVEGVHDFWVASMGLTCGRSHNNNYMTLYNTYTLLCTH